MPNGIGINTSEPVMQQHERSENASSSTPGAAQHPIPGDTATSTTPHAQPLINHELNESTARSIAHKGNPKYENLSLPPELQADPSKIDLKELTKYKLSEFEDASTAHSGYASTLKQKLMETALSIKGIDDNYKGDAKMSNDDTLLRKGLSNQQTELTTKIATHENHAITFKKLASAHLNRKRALWKKFEKPMSLGMAGINGLMMLMILPQIWEMIPHKKGAGDAAAADDSVAANAAASAYSPRTAASQSPPPYSASAVSPNAASSLPPDYTPHTESPVGSSMLSGPAVLPSSLAGMSPAAQKALFGSNTNMAAPMASAPAPTPVAMRNGTYGMPSY